MRSEFVRKKKAILGLGLVVPRWKILEKPWVDARVASSKRWRSSSSSWRERLGIVFVSWEGGFGGQREKKKKRKG